MKDSSDHNAASDGPDRDGRVLIVGARRRLGRLAGVLEQRPWSSLPIVGYVDRSGRGRQLAVHPGSEPVPVLGRLDRLPELIRRSRATHVLVALPNPAAARPSTELAALDDPNLRIHWVEDAALAAREAGVPHHRYRPDHLGVRSWRLALLAKRVLDFVAAGLALLVLSPLLIAVAALIYCTSGRPIFYLQDRVGRGGRIFRIVKFRSMKPNAERETGPIWAANHDDRCTPVGDWLRQSSIDELPQLINILKGEMSLVGPRPERPMFVEQFVAEIPDYPLRHAVPAGLTGWAQVHGWRGRTSIKKRLQYDLDYIGRWSFWLDLKILWMTVLHVAVGKCDWGVPKNRRIERETTDALGRDSHPQWPDPAGPVPVEPPPTPPAGAA